MHLRLRQRSPSSSGKMTYRLDDLRAHDADGSDSLRGRNVHGVEL